ncbi:MAG: protein-disulfide reductase DsbD, partial [Gammaproteobacteria bacterium]|nr:protein-disulfide reductase DsbD [Gammaproteobacteria bacterium]
MRWRAFVAAAVLLACAGAVAAQIQDQSTAADRAYRLSADAAADKLQFTWTIDQGHFLFRNKFRFRVDTPGVILGAPRLPPAQVIADDFLGDIEVYTDRVVVDVPLSFVGAPASGVDVRVVAQGCALGGDCSPPFTEELRIQVPATATGATPRSSPAAADQSGAGATPNPLAALMELGQSIGGSIGEVEFLDPDVAFELRTEVEDEDTIVAHWQIADGYYLYRNKFRFALAEGKGVSLGSPALPAGKIKVDDYFGKMEVYYHDVLARVPVERSAGGATTVALDVVYQGCADAGLCYPPITKRVNLKLPVSHGTGPSARVPDPVSPSIEPAAPANVELPEQDRIARSLASGNTLLVLLSFFGLGLLLTFTPCVFPMIPILSSIIVSQGDNIGTRKAFALSLTYVLAMAATYTTAGVLAGAFGANLQAAFQNPWILTTFSIVFVLLALSMFGFYDLQIPAGLQAKLARASGRQQGGTFVGVAIMGFLSALIVGPCVAAPLAGALIYIGQTGDAVLGGMALFALSMGMGAPVLLVGTSVGKLLPRAGPWMEPVKAVFGVLLLGVAIYLVERMVPEWIALLLWGALLIVAAIYLGALDTLAAESSGWRRFRKGAGLVMLIYGVLLVVGGSGGGNDVWQPLKGLASGPAGESQEGLVFQRVKGSRGLDAALRVASAQGRPVMLDYYADWCVSCKEMERYTFSDASVQAALGNTLLLQTDVTANDAEDQELLKRFNLFGPPAILFFGPDGRERPNYRVVGYMKAQR